MALIEELLKLSHSELAAMDENKLREELKDAINLEPKANPVPLTDSVETSYTKSEEEDDNPIKLRKKKTSKKSAAENLIDTLKFIEEL